MKRIIFFVLGFMFVPLMMLMPTFIEKINERNVDELQELYEKTVNSNSIKCNEHEVENGRYKFDDSKRKTVPISLICYNGELDDISSIPTKTLTSIRHISLLGLGVNRQILNGLESLKVIDKMTFLHLQNYELNDLDFLREIEFYGDDEETLENKIGFGNVIINDNNFMNYINANETIVNMKIVNTVINGCLIEEISFNNLPKPWTLHGC